MVLVFLGEAPTVTEAGFSKYIYGIFGNNYPITGYYSTELNYNVEVTVLSQQEKIIFEQSRENIKGTKNLFDNRWYAHPVQFIQT